MKEAAAMKCNRLRRPSIVLLAVLCAAPAVSPGVSQPRNDDHAREVELQRRADEARGAECAKLSMQVARQSLEDADRLFRSGNTQAAQAAIDVSLHYAQRSVDCTLQSHKHLTSIEIELRHLIRRMNDVARMIDTEDRRHLKRVLAELNQERDRLLQGIFGPAAATSRKTQ
jgi:hypothetical protein